MSGSSNRVPLKKTRNILLRSTVLSAQVSPTARRPVMATDDSPGPGSAADLSPSRRSVGVTQSTEGFFQCVRVLK